MSLKFYYITYLLPCRLFQYSNDAFIQTGRTISKSGRSSNCSMVVMVGVFTDVVNCWKNIPEHRMLLNNANNVRNSKRTASDRFFGCCPVELKVTPSVWMKILDELAARFLVPNEPKFWLNFRTIVNVIIVMAQIRLIGLLSIDCRSLEADWYCVGTTTTNGSNACGYNCARKYATCSTLKCGETMITLL